MHKFKLFLLAVFLALPISSLAADGALIERFASGVYDVEYLQICDGKVAANEGAACCTSGSPCSADGLDLSLVARGMGEEYAIFIDSVDASCAQNVTVTLHLVNRAGGRNHTHTTVLTNTGTDTLFWGPTLRYIKPVLTNLGSCASTGVDVGLYIFRPRN